MRNLLFLIVLVCFLFQLFTLGRFPLPSNEEVELVSAARYLSEKGMENLFAPDFDEVHRTSLGNAPLPVLLNAVLLEKYEIDAFDMRLVNCDFGVLVVLLLFFYFTKMERGSFKNASILMTAALLLDPILNSRPHSSMSEWIALLFLLLSFKKEFDKEGHTFKSTISAAFFLALAFYSSSQLLVFLPYILLYKLVKALKEARENQFNSLYHMATWPFLFALFYLPWFFNIHDISTFYVGWQKPQGLVFMPLAEQALCLGSLFLLFYSFSQKYTYNYPTIVWLCIGLIVSYHVASYFFLLSPSLIIPFYYLLAFALLPLNTTNSKARQTRYFPLALLAGIHSLLFLIQFVYCLLDYRGRSGVGLHEFVQKMVLPKSHVTGDATLFYGVADNGHTFRLVHNEQKLKAYVNAHDFEYLLLSQHFLQSIHDTSFFSLHSENIQKLGTLTYPPVPLTDVVQFLGMADPKEENLFSCVLFKYKR